MDIFTRVNLKPRTWTRKRRLGREVQLGFVTRTAGPLILLSVRLVVAGSHTMVAKGAERRSEEDHLHEDDGEASGKRRRVQRACDVSFER